MNEDKKKVPPRPEPTPDEVRERFIKAVLEGLADAEAGRVHSDEAVEARLAKRFR